MDSLPELRIVVVATTPLEALTDWLDSLIFLDMTWGPKHETSVYVSRDAQCDKLPSFEQQREHLGSTGVSR